MIFGRLVQGLERVECRQVVGTQGERLLEVLACHAAIRELIATHAGGAHQHQDAQLFVCHLRVRSRAAACRRPGSDRRPWPGDRAPRASHRGRRRPAQLARRARSRSRHVLRQRGRARHSRLHGAARRGARVRPRTPRPPRARGSGARDRPALRSAAPTRGRRPRAWHRPKPPSRSARRWCLRVRAALRAPRDRRRALPRARWCACASTRPSGSAPRRDPADRSPARVRAARCRVGPDTSRTLRRRAPARPRSRGRCRSGSAPRYRRRWHVRGR